MQFRQGKVTETKKKKLLWAYAMAINLPGWTMHTQKCTSVTHSGSGSSIIMVHCDWGFTFGDLIDTCWPKKTPCTEWP